jgi:PIN domain nuclease of toxin-antitoxin system
MNLLIDTHSFLWFVWLDAKLSTAAHALMADPNNKLYFSPASFWEMAIKVSLKVLDLGEPFDVFVPREVNQLNLAILSIEMRHAAVLLTLPYHHKDPLTEC